MLHQELLHRSFLEREVAHILGKISVIEEILESELTDEDQTDDR